MRPTNLEERLAQLERRVDELAQGKSASGTVTKDWRRTVGMFRDDPVMKEVIDEAQRMREFERALARDEQRSEKP